MLNLKKLPERTLSLLGTVLETILRFSASPAAAEGSPEEIAKALLAAEAVYNIDQAVAMFTDDAVVSLGNGQVINTRDGIRQWQQELAAGHFHFEAVNIHAEGSTVSWTGASSLDAFRHLGIAAMGSNWKVVIANDKIKTFDFTFTPEALTSLQAGIVVATLIDAENAHDVEKAVATFAADAIVRHEGGAAFETTDAIRKWQQGLADGNFHLEPVGLVVEGNVVRWVGAVSLDNFRKLGIATLDGVWKLVIEGGKIKTFDYSWTPEAAQKLKAAVEAQTKSAS